MPPFFLKYSNLKKKFKRLSQCHWSFGFFVLLFALGFPGGSCLAANSAQEVFSARVIKVVDGDSLELKHKGRKLRVRLWGIDSPEWQQEFSQKALAYTRSRIQGQMVEVQPRAWDKYGRLVAIVKVGGVTLNEDLLTEGLAWVHIYYCKEPICREWRQLEKEARRARRGLWQSNDPIAPWQWKRGHK